MQNNFSMKVCQPFQCLPSQGAYHTSLKLAMLPKTTSHAATRYIFEKDTDGHFLALAAKVLNNVDMVEMLHCINFLVQRRYHLTHLLLVVTSGFGTNFDLLDG